MRHPRWSSGALAAATAALLAPVAHATTFEMDCKLADWCPTPDPSGSGKVCGVNGKAADDCVWWHEIGFASPNKYAICKMALQRKDCGPGNGDMPGYGDVFPEYACLQWRYELTDPSDADAAAAPAQYTCAKSTATSTPTTTTNSPIAPPPTTSPKTSEMPPPSATTPPSDVPGNPAPTSGDPAPTSPKTSETPPPSATPPPSDAPSNPAPTSGDSDSSETPKPTPPPGTPGGAPGGGAPGGSPGAPGGGAPGGGAPGGGAPGGGTPGGGAPGGGAPGGAPSAPGGGAPWAGHQWEGDPGVSFPPPNPNSVQLPSNFYGTDTPPSIPQQARYQENLTPIDPDTWVNTWNPKNFKWMAPPPDLAGPPPRQAPNRGPQPDHTIDNSRQLANRLPQAVRDLAPIQPPVGPPPAQPPAQPPASPPAQPPANPPTQPPANPPGTPATPLPEPPTPEQLEQMKKAEHDANVDAWITCGIPVFIIIAFVAIIVPVVLTNKHDDDDKKDKGKGKGDDEDDALSRRYDSGTNGDFWSAPKPEAVSGYIECTVPGPTLKTTLLPAWACINGLLVTQTTLLPSPHIPTNVPAIAAVASPEKTTIGAILNETLPQIQRYIADPKALTDSMKNLTAEQQQASKVAEMHAKRISSGVEKGPDGHWFPKELEALDKTLQAIWGQPLLLTFSTSEGIVSQLAWTFREGVGPAVWESMARVAAYLISKASADTPDDAHVQERAPGTYTYLVGQAMVEMLTSEVGLYDGVDPATNQTKNVYTGFTVEDQLGKAVKDMGIDQDNLPPKDDGSDSSIWDWVAPDFLAAYVASNNHMTKYKNDTAVVHEIEYIKGLLYAGETGPYLHDTLGYGKNIPWPKKPDNGTHDEPSTAPSPPTSTEKSTPPSTKTPTTLPSSKPTVPSTSKSTVETTAKYTDTLTNPPTSKPTVSPTAFELPWGRLSVTSMSMPLSTPGVELPPGPPFASPPSTAFVTPWPTALTVNGTVNVTKVWHAPQPTHSQTKGVLEYQW